MHASSMENMQRCIDWYLPQRPLKVVDLGAMNVNGSYRSLLPSGVEYVGIDLGPGPGVDIVLEDPYRLPFPDGSVDLVLSGQMLEHCGQFWRVFTEMARILTADGLAFVIAPSAGGVHRYPVDCYRFYPDSYAALADWCGLRLVHTWTDERGPWEDKVGVFQKGQSLQQVRGPRPAKVTANGVQSPHADPAAEARKGARPYLELLHELHQLLEPRLYLEIGIRRGSSLALSKGPAVAVDPDPHPDLRVGESVLSFYRCTSDDFFFFHREHALPAPVDLAFIDGMHLAEYVYRDFLNVERVMHPSGAIVIDDVFPNHPLQASRTRQTQVWTGDVWRFADLLAQMRPDLRLTWLDTDPSGLLIITGLGAHNGGRLLKDYNPTVRALESSANASPPAAVMSRERAVAPTTSALRMALNR